MLSDGNGGKVGTIDFTYHNSWIIDNLKEKGDCIKWQEWEKLNILNKQMTTRLKEDIVRIDAAVYSPNDPNLETCIIDPISAFVTMESEDAYNFLATKDPPEIDLGGEKSEIYEALEPTNIIWENYDMDILTQVRNFTLIVLVTCFVLGVTFMVSFQAKAEEKELIGIYDNSISCSDVAKIYSAPELSKLAADEWYDYYKKGGEDMDRQISENLACFCTA